MLDHWRSLARHTPLAILTDLDGTLIPFAPTPEDALPDAELVALLRSLGALPGLHLVIVTGRPHDVLERQLGDLPIWLVAEHGAWCRAEGAWQPMIEADATPILELSEQLERVVRGYSGGRVERKTWSCAVHYRLVAPYARAAFGVEVTVAIDDFLDRHPTFERVDGNMAIEIRATAARKSLAVGWTRNQVGGGARVIAVGDDLTDEHLFAALDPVDESVLVRNGSPRSSRARWQVEDVAAARKLLSFVRDTRLGEAPSDLALKPIRPAAPSRSPSESLVIVSNRLPDLRSAEPVDSGRRGNVGGLVSALEPLLAARGGLWLGWGGRIVPDTDEPGHGLDEGTPSLAWFDYKQSWHRDYYNGFCNATLWPLFHSFVSRAVIKDGTYAAYVSVHETFADEVQRYASSADTVWVHDYHLLLLARALRSRGHRGRLGFFLHTPFPAIDILAVLPWAAEIVDAMLEFDLLGFHTPGYLANFLRCAGELVGARSGPNVVEHRGHVTRVDAFPLGILSASFQEAPEPTLVQEIESLTRSLGSAKLVLAVDRLDYTKGIKERLTAFGRLLELFPEWCGKVSLIQISVPSRADVPEYMEQRASVERIVGRVNGERGEADWVPIRYLYRSYTRPHLSQLYRAARVGWVTPLRDGMNLVAKEYLAAQDPDDPGVLVLSRFAGAAYEMKDAILTNPYHVDGMARDLDRALRAPLAERRQRHARSLGVVERTTAESWATSFLDTLRERPSPSGPT